MSLSRWHVLRRFSVITLKTCPDSPVIHTTSTSEQAGQVYLSYSFLATFLDHVDRPFSVSHSVDVGRIIRWGNQHPPPLMTREGFIGNVLNVLIMDSVRNWRDSLSPFFSPSSSESPWHLWPRRNLLINSNWEESFSCSFSISTLFLAEIQESFFSLTCTPSPP